MKSVSIIVLSLNSGEHIRECLESLVGIDYPREKLEIVLVDGGSTDDTLEIAQGFPIRIIMHRKIGFGSARNVALRVARNEVICFVDSDCVVERNWLKKLIAPLKGDIVAVGGPSLPPKSNTFSYCVSALGYPAGGITRAMQPSSYTNDLSTCNVVILKSSLQEIGGFDERFVFGAEDTDLMKRLVKNGKLYFESSAWVYHSPRETLRAFVKWWFRRGKADVQFHKKYLRAYPRSLFSPKRPRARLQHTGLLSLLLIGLCVLNWFYAFCFILVVAFLAALGIVKMQKRFIKVKERLNLPRIYYWTLIPFLDFVKDISRDLGRIYGFILQELILSIN